MLPALALALDDAPAAGRLQQVVFLTDGAVGNEEALLRVVAERLGERRLFTVGIGSAPNSYFMRKAAEVGRGSFTHIGDLREVKPRMAALLTKLEQPALTDLRVGWPLTAGKRIELYPTRRRSEEHTSELQSLMRISYAVFCLKKKKKTQHRSTSAEIKPHHST